MIRIITKRIINDCTRLKIYSRGKSILVGSRFGSLAQLVEQRTENPRVSGPIPLGATKYIKNKLHAVPNFCTLSLSSRIVDTVVLGLSAGHHQQC